jgi:hypothetical protein
LKYSPFPTTEQFKNPQTQNVRNWALEAHACNPSYSGGRDQDSNSKPAQANSSQDSILKKPFTKKELIEWLKVRP